MYYQINVSLNGQHFFTTEKNISKAELEKIYNVLKAKFTEQEGFKIDVMLWESVGKIIEMN